MGYALRPGLHFCAVGEQLIFLDLEADRYFALGDRAAATFGRLVGGGDVAGDELESMLRSGLIERRSDGRPAPCPAIALPRDSAADGPTPRPSVRQRMAALLALNATRRDLRQRGLSYTIESLRQSKEMRRTAAQRDVDLCREAAAFAWTTRWLRSHDQCLSRSLALTRHLIGAGVDANLVIGIRLRPFAAHCWTQTRELIVNDRFDQVRSYQPILVV